jgi:tRNA(Ile)-lysidine synthase
MSAARDGKSPPADAKTKADASNRSWSELFAGWERYEHIALAVSGGADSVALMRLAYEQQQTAREASAPFPQLSVLTVNHGLRQEAATEAEWVHAEATRLGLAHHTLEWLGEKPSTGIQAAARQARYALMADFCRTHNIGALAVAHTQDDQAETLLMRLARGSGVDGLAGMSAVSRQHGLAILRPLLGVSRTELEAWLRKHEQGWLEDPSNQNTHYERVRIRRALQKGQTLGLTAEKLALSAKRLGRAREALEAVTSTFLNEVLYIHDTGYAEMALEPLLRQPEEIAFRALARVILIIRGGEAKREGQIQAPPLLRMARLEALLAALRSDAPGGTIAGCTVNEFMGSVLFIREYGRMDKTPIALRPGQHLVWDRRFSITPAEDAVTDLTVRPLGADGFAAIKAMGGVFGTTAYRAAITLPSLWDEEKLVYAPNVIWPYQKPHWRPQKPASWLDGTRVKCLISPARD